MKKNKDLFISVLLVFFISVNLLVIVFWVKGIYPGSDRSILISDLASQYVSFFGYLHHLGEGYNSLLYQHLSGLGGDFYGIWAYYLASPLSFLVLLFDLYDLPDAIYFLIILKISLSAITMCIYLRLGRIKCNNRLIIIIASLSYAFMSYNIIYSFCLMWLDGVIMLPLVILGIDKIYEGKSSLLFCLALSCALIFNYYTGYMICLFVIIYYCYYCFSYNIGFYESIKKGINIFIYGVISVLLSSFVWIPVIIGLKNGRLSQTPYVISGIIRNPINVLRSFLPFSYDDLTPDGNPNIYCGMIVLLGAISFFFSKKISLRKKISSIVVILIFYISFCTGKLDALWHGMQIPNFFPARYSFIFSFFLISLFADYSNACIFLFNIFHVLSDILLIVFCLFELSANAIFSITSLSNDEFVGPYVSRYSYISYFYQYDELKKYVSDENRVVLDLYFSSNDGLLFGVPSLNLFSSSYSFGFSNFTRYIGLKTMYQSIDDNGLSPLSAVLFGIDFYYNNDVQNDNSISEYFDVVNNDFDLGYYKNDNSTIGLLIDHEIESNIDFTYNCFDNLNIVNNEITKTDNVFVPCKVTYDTEIGFDDEDIIYKRYYNVFPDADMNLYFYVSFEDAIDDGKNCFDRLSFNNKKIALYIDTNFRYLVNMGMSDGTKLDFLFESYSEDSDVWFYSFNDDAFKNTMKILDDISLKDYNYSKDGINAAISTSNDCLLLLLLPYEKGYSIFVDGIETDYSSYRNALITVPVREGRHDILIKYYPPGLKIGLIVSLFSLILLIAIQIVCLNKHKA